MRDEFSSESDRLFLLVLQRFLYTVAVILFMAASPLRAAYPIQGTFLNFYRNLTPDLWRLEFDYMRAADINTIFIVSVGHLQAAPTPAMSCSIPGSGNYMDSSGYSLASDGLLYPSDSVDPTQRPAIDLLEVVLSLADSAGMTVYVGSLQTETDWSTGTAFCALREYNRRVAGEVLQRYGHHPSLKGWYFTQELWMNWIKFYGQDQAGAAGYYGTNLIAQWCTDMKALDPQKLTTTALVVKEFGTGLMPGLTSAELQQWTGSFLETAKLDILMPQDGAGAQAGAPPITDLPAYYAAMAAAISAGGSKTALWSTVELFTASADPNATGEQYPPVKDVTRIQSQIDAVHPFVSGYVSWMFGDDLSPQATYYPVEADRLGRIYESTYKPALVSSDDVIPLRTYWYPSLQPDAAHSDSSIVPLLSDGTGGGYNGATLSNRVGFSNPAYGTTSVQVIADLGEVRAIHRIRALTQSWSRSGILHPSQMIAEISHDGTNWLSFGTAANFPSDSPEFAVMWGEVSGSATGRFVRWSFDYSQWLFLAELEVLGPK